LKISSIGTAIGAIITGVIIANILTHPVGTQAAANSIATVAKPTLNALLGQTS